VWNECIEDERLNGIMLGVDILLHDVLGTAKPLALNKAFTAFAHACGIDDNNPDV
jgi:hypothetical protein